jgi:aspartate/methionine/tyrosine aminotransferase
MPQLLHEWGHPEPSRLAFALDERRQRGEAVFDFIQANPQEHGFEYPPELLSKILNEAIPRARFYRPDPRGQLAAREAVAQYHGQVGHDQVVLTPGTSLAYWYVFRLLARPGGNVLCPRPTYPLFDDLLKLAGLNGRSYHLSRDAQGRWLIDPEELEFQITPHTCAIVIVSPHNPTGMVASRDQLEAVGEIASRHRLPVVFDEVFREFLHRGSEVPRPRDFSPPLCITLNGLSKMLSLPGMKAGWMVVEGTDKQLVREFLAALEYLSDTFLPVNEIVQAALPGFLAPDSLRVSREFANRYRERMAALRKAWLEKNVAVDNPDGGVYLPVPLPRHVSSDEDVALRLLEECGIYCHAGSSYGMGEPYLITTCVPTPPWPIREMAKWLARL